MLAGADDDRTRSGAAPAAEAADMLEQLGAPSAAWGAQRPRPRAAGTRGDDVVLPQVARGIGPSAPGLVRVEAPEPRRSSTAPPRASRRSRRPSTALSGFDYAGGRHDRRAAPRKARS